MCVCVCIYVYICVCIYTHTHIYLMPYIHIHTHIYLLPYITYVFDAICIHIYTHTHIYLMLYVYMPHGIYIFESPLVKHRLHEFILCFAPFCIANASCRSACPRVVIQLVFIVRMINSIIFYLLCLSLEGKNSVSLIFISLAFIISSGLFL